MKKIIGRFIVLIPAILIQVLWYLILISFFAKYMALFICILSVLSVIFVLYLVSKKDESSYKILWLILIMALPILGAFLYVCWGNKKTSRPLQKKLYSSKKNINIILEQNSVISESLKSADKRASQTFEYIRKMTGFPVVRNTHTEYYSLGEDMFEDMCKELKKAQRFIFLEYFIVQEGIFWNTIVDILAEKAEQGVDVRIMYDDLGCISTYSASNAIKLMTKKIKCIPFNPMIFVKASLNNRDHRKIMVIDGKVAFSGGINIADEYINQKERFGHWKDIGFKITGKSVQSYTYMFMEFWNAFSANKMPEKYLDNTLFEFDKKNDNGYVISYYDSPFYPEAVSNNVFIEILSQATEYVWFYTPYLMLGDALLDAFVRTAERGVDVRIIMPGIPDKKVIFKISRSYYKQLLESGVKIYEYSAGFVHAKACICDDKIATIGTVNLDYRSLFLHFECSSVFYNSKIVTDLKNDFMNTQEQCKERTLKDEKKGILNKITDAVLRLFAPLC